MEPVSSPATGPVAAMGTAFQWWRSAAEISPRVIADEAARGFTVALIGPPEARSRLRESLLEGCVGEAALREAGVHLREFDAAPGEDLSKAISFRLWAPESGASIGGRDHRSFPFSGDRDAVVRDMLRLRPDLAIALARRFPIFRGEACRVLVRSACVANAQIALLSALPGVLPITAPFLPAAAIADAVVLTKNQAMLVMRIAAAYGHRPGYTRQVRELLATVASALGWRTLAREAVSVVPAGVGAAVKGAIAWSGTYAVGRAAIAYQERGSRPAPVEIRAWETEGRKGALEAVESLDGGTAKPHEPDTAGANDDSPPAI
ncbi:MAG: hypothetical protein ACKO5K_15075 [Armatimonadota bacterium]